MTETPPGVLDRLSASEASIAVRLCWVAPCFHPTQALPARGGGRLLLVAPASEEALARQRAQAVRCELASRLPAAVAAAPRIEVHGGDGRVLQQLTIEPPSGPPPAGPNSGEGR